MITTTSKVLMSGHTAEPVRKLLIETAEWITQHGGTYSVKTEYWACDWYLTYVFNWPDNIPHPSSLTQFDTHHTIEAHNNAFQAQQNKGNTL